MGRLQSFGKADLALLQCARLDAEALVKSFYALAPREWERMNYEVRTLRELEPEEISDEAFAQVRCYELTRRVGQTVIDRYDLYRICLQDHRILQAARRTLSDWPAAGEQVLKPLLLYVLTHELVHVVRFAQQMQRLDLAPELRPQEEMSVEQTTRQILAPVADRSLRCVLETFGHGCRPTYRPN
jgi:hypothetical protein